MWVYIVIGIGVVFLLILCFCLAVANFSFDNFKEKRDEARRYGNSLDMTVEEFVEDVIAKHLKGNLKIETCEEYQDHFRVGAIALSQSTRRSNSLATFSTVSHELGHAIQYEKANSQNIGKKHRKIA